MPAIAAPIIFIASHPVATVACVVSYMILGMIWFGPLFGKPWARLTSMDKVPKKKMKKQMFSAMTVSILSAILQASVIGTTLSIVQIESYTSLVSLIVLMWLPFTGCVLATNYAYTMKPVKLLLIDAFYPLVTWVAMAFIFLYVQF